MFNQNFRFPDSKPERLAVVRDTNTGKVYFPLYNVLAIAKVAPANKAVAWAKANIPEKWIVLVKIPGSEHDLYLTKAGFFYVMCQGKSDKAVRFRDWVFEDLMDVNIDDISGF